MSEERYYEGYKEGYRDGFKDGWKENNKLNQSLQEKILQEKEKALQEKDLISPIVKDNYSVVVSDYVLSVFVNGISETLYWLVHNKNKPEFKNFFDSFYAELPVCFDFEKVIQKIVSEYSACSKLGGQEYMKYVEEARKGCK